jgi:hypothetical protein
LFGFGGEQDSKGDIYVQRFDGAPTAFQVRGGAQAEGNYFIRLAEILQLATE